MYVWFNPMPSKTDLYFFFIQETLLWDSSNQRNDWGETKDELKTFSNNTGGRSPATHCERYSQWEQGNETYSYGCLCSIPYSLISLEAIVCVLHRKKSRVNQAKQGNAVSHKTYVPCVVDWQITSSVLDNMLVMSSYCRKTQSVPRKSPHEIISGFSIVTMCGTFLRSYLIYVNTYKCIFLIFFLYFFVFSATLQFKILGSVSNFYLAKIEIK